MNTKFFLIVVLCMLSCEMSSQINKDANGLFQKKNSLNLEFGGYALIGELYYERVIFNNEKSKTTGQIGIGLGGFPLIINQLISFNNSHLEFGIGILFPEYKSIRVLENTKSHITGRIGYRYQKPGGSFIFRVGLMPLITIDYYWLYTGFPGISFGYAF